MTQRDQGAPRQSLQRLRRTAAPLSEQPLRTRRAPAHGAPAQPLARHEINVGKYYLRRDAWVAAAARGEYMLEHYPQSRTTGDALALMAESYRSWARKNSPTTRAAC